jgi:hypothetical protein
MISFRFHVVSITAVFLAIAIGVVVGSTYVDRAIVENLQHRIDNVSSNLDQRKQENDRLEGQVSRSRTYIESSADYAVTDRLTDLPVAVFAVRGIDEDAAKATVLLARRAGAIVPGIVWLEPRWELATGDDRAALATALGVAPTSATKLRTAAWRAISVGLTAASASVDGVPTEATTKADRLLAALQTDGFLTVDAVSGDEAVSVATLVGASPRVLVLTGADAVDQIRPMVASVVAAPAEAGLRTVLADVYVDRTGGPGRGVELSASVPKDDRDAVAVVDHADTPEGRVAAVVSLAADSGGGHFGYGTGADAVLPGWTPP